MKVVIKFPETQHKWIKKVLEIQKKQGYISVRKASHLLELKEPNMPSYLLSSAWIKEVVEE